MSKHFETYEHPSDLGLAARADSLAELFEALGEGLAEQVCPRATVYPAEVRTVSVQSDGRELLAVDFLTALLRLFQLERFLIARVAVARIDEGAVTARVEGERFDAARHELGPEIKAVTYHQLTVRQEGGLWVARVLLDL